MDGVIPFPQEFAELYRAKGYWRDVPLRTVFRGWCDRFADRTALIDTHRTVSFRELDQRSTNLALSLLDMGIGPRDRLVVQMPHVIEFAYLH